MRSYDIAEWGAPLKAFDRPTPKPEGTEVLLRTTAAGVCHSDVHIWEGYFDLGGGKRFHMADRGMKLPHTLGHEIAGEVIAVGPKATGVKKGQKRLVYPWIGCGTCAVCKAGDENLCMAPRFLGVQKPGGYSDHVLVPHPRYLLDIGKMKPAEAAPYACSGLTTYSALRKVGSKLKTQPIVIIGAGGLGLMCLSLHKAMKGKGAIVVDIDPAKRAAAMKMGAMAAIDGAAADAVKQVRDAAGGPVWAAIDLVGAPATAQLGLDSLIKGGTLIIVGLFGGGITLPLPTIPQRALTIQGSYVGNLAELKKLMALVRQRKIPSIPITPRPFDYAATALEELRGGKVVGRTVLTV
ncbi:MAG TPA: alcohol dehydrogenase [Alphaproteobacteria bacterium]|nr:alcohol dehydrogenase [Alphaproteobacteria bacterium]